ncbi:hypothetical protein OFC51_36020, partial [Escherichia coli]|nr:hypothetical protein [Escherichia coli]
GGPYRDDYPGEWQHHAAVCGAGESAVHERRVPEATVCGEHHVIRQSSDVFPDAGWQADSPQCGYQWSHHGEYRHAQ